MYAQLSSGQCVLTDQVHSVFVISEANLMLDAAKETFNAYHSSLICVLLQNRNVPDEVVEQIVPDLIKFKRSVYQCIRDNVEAKGSFDMYAKPMLDLLGGRVPDSVLEVMKDILSSVFE